jgi:hypothetical protein
MLPLTILAAQKFGDLLTVGDALQQQIAEIAISCNANVPAIAAEQVLLSSANSDIGDRNIELMYPRVCLYTGGVKNTQIERFRSLSGTVAVTAEIWASGNLVTNTDQWIHFYVEAATNILRQNIGDWGDGIFFSGVYDVQFQAPKAGGLGFVQSAKITCNLNVSRN